MFLSAIAPSNSPFPATKFESCRVGNCCPTDPFYSTQDPLTPLARALFFWLRDFPRWPPRITSLKALFFKRLLEMGESLGFLGHRVVWLSGRHLSDLASRKRKSEALLALTEAEPSIGFPAALLSRRVVLALASLPPPQESQSLPSLPPEPKK